MKGRLNAYWPVKMGQNYPGQLEATGINTFCSVYKHCVYSSGFQMSRVIFLIYKFAHYLETTQFSGLQMQHLCSSFPMLYYLKTSFNSPS